MPLIRKYEHLFFDLDNTLWDFDANARLAMQETLSILKLENRIPDFDRFYHYYEQVNTSLWEAYRKQEIRKNELTTKRFEDTLNHFQIGGIDPVAMNDLYLHVMPRQTQLVEGAIETLDYLQSRHYQLHIITNGFKEVQHQKLKTSGLAPYFTRVFISEEIQYPKPDVRIFKHALMNCNARKEKSIMIGDSWETDILGALHFGITTIFIPKKHDLHNVPPKNEGNTQINTHKTKDTPTNKIHTIQKLTQILDIL